MNQTKQINNSLFLETIQNLDLSDLFIILYESSIATNKDCQIWFVGGLVRDCLLGKVPEIIDFDLIVKPFEKSLWVTEQITKILQSPAAHYFVLDKERNTYRITQDSFQMDINAIRGEELIDDLFCRDFSINSISYTLNDVVRALKENLPYVPLLDYFSGIEDLLKSLVRAQNPSSFLEDPLRILRAYRFASYLNGTIEENTSQWMEQAKENLRFISPERIRDEFCLILKNPDSYSIIIDMEKSGILEVFFPFLPLFSEIDKTYTTKLQVKNHTLSLLYYLEQIFMRIERQEFPYWEILAPILHQAFSGGRSLCVLLKIAGLLHDIGKPSTLSVETDRLRFFNHETVGASMASIWMENMKFSNTEIGWISKIIEYHMRPHNLSNAEVITPKARYRFFRECSETAIPLLLLALADAYATRLILMGELSEYEKFVSDMLAFYSIPEQIKPVPLLNGNEIMEILSIPPSKQIGALLEELLEFQSLKQIQNKEEAIIYLKNKKL
jgi:putative nucleotidyltransferase with HDIG domain